MIASLLEPQALRRAARRTQNAAGRPSRGALAQEAAKNAFLKLLHPRALAENPVVLAMALAALLGTILVGGAWIQGASALPFGGGGLPPTVVGLLWLTVLVSTFSEALAEGRGRAQASALRGVRSDNPAQRLKNPDTLISAKGESPAFETVPASDLVVGDVVLVEAGAMIPGDGEVIHGAAAVDESSITGESAPVIRESGGDRSAVTGGTVVLSDRLVVRITAASGASFLDRMIGLVEGASRAKTPNEVALTLLLVGLSFAFLVVVSTLPFFAKAAGGATLSPLLLTALFVLLAPTTIGGLLSAIGIAGMNRLLRLNVLALSGRAVEAAGDVDTLLLDKTGTITLGNRQAAAFLPLPGITEREVAEAAWLTSRDDGTPEGRSIVALAHDRYGIQDLPTPKDAVFVPFTAATRMSGLDASGRSWRKGAIDATLRFVRIQHGATAWEPPPELASLTDQISRTGGTPLAVTDGTRILGVVHLKDIIKTGMRERFLRLRAMGIRTLMVTGDNPLTAAAIATEAGVDDFLAEARPEDKLRLIRAEQAQGKLVAMCGDGTNDAPALAQADVGLAMQTGTQAAREAGNMVDLDSNPTKLIEVVLVGKQLLITRGALTTFSVANDIAKYFAVLPILLRPGMSGGGDPLPWEMTSPASALLAALVFNALVIVALLPLALRGVTYTPQSASRLLARNLALYGLGGVITPFVAIPLLDRLVVACGLF